MTVVLLVAANLRIRTADYYYIFFYYILESRVGTYNIIYSVFYKCKILTDNHIVNFAM